MLESWRHLCQVYPWLQSIWDALGIIIPLSCMLAFAGAVFISALAKIIYVSQKRASFNKCSRQIGMLALILGWALMIGGRIWLYLNPHESGTLENFLLEMSWLLLSLGVLLTTIYYTFWKILVNMPVLHVTIGMISAVQNCLALACILFTIRISAGISVVDADSLKLPELFPQAWNAPLWNACAYTLPLIFAYAGAFSACWVAFRRKFDNFGRDYYNQMLPWCAKWARNSWIILWLIFAAASATQLYYARSDEDRLMEDLLLEGTRLLFWLLPLLLWIMAARSAIPMRHRLSLILALVLASTFSLPYFLDLTLI